MQREAASFRSGTDLSAKVPIVHHQGLFVHTGHGSRGLLSCPLGGELLARLINHEELCDLEQVLQIVTPDRLPYRML